MTQNVRLTPVLLLEVLPCLSQKFAHKFTTASMSNWPIDVCANAVVQLTMSIHDWFINWHWQPSGCIFNYYSKLLCFYLPDLVISGPHKRRRENLVFLIDDRWAIVSHLPPVVLCSAAHHGTRRKIGFVCSSHGFYVYSAVRKYATICN